MSEIGKLKAEPKGEREIVITRAFEAPRDDVFEAYTKPEWVQHWLGVYGGWSMELCEIEPRVDGAWRYVWRGPKGERMGWRGVCRELDPPSRIRTSNTFDEPWFEGGEEATVDFEEHGSRTLLTVTLRYDSRRVRDEVLEGPMTAGMAVGYDRLDELLAAPAERWMDFEAGAPSSGTWHA